MALKSRFAKGNHILEAIRPEDRDLLDRHLESATLARHQKLERPLQPIRKVYFMSHAVASVLAIHGDGSTVEIGVIGCEGMTGTSLILGDDRSPHLTLVQVAGDAYCISVDHLQRCVNESRTLQRSLLRYANAFSTQIAHTAVANARGSLQKRLARWLLMAHDRVPGNEVALTHELLSLVLGVRRAGVTEALHSFQADEFIMTRRGHITIVDRDRLEKVAGAFYGKPEAEYRRLLQ